MPVCFVICCVCSGAYWWLQRHRPSYSRHSILRQMDNYQETTLGRRRNLIGFWFLGLTNNFAYVIMLSAAHDILDPKHDKPHNGTDPYPTLGPSTNISKLVPDCNPIGTGAILLADILPTLAIKLTAPFFIHMIPYSLKVATVILFNAASFPIVAASKSMWLSLSGVVCASIGGGLGEITFLSLSTHFNKNVVSTWSSGTGMAGVGGALSYAGLTAIGLSPRVTLYIMLVVPVLMAVSYYILLDKPPSVEFGLRSHYEKLPNESDTLLPNDVLATEYTSEEVRTEIDEAGINEPVDPAAEPPKQLNLKENLSYIVPLLKYMIPLALVYFAEYFINQALFELITFHGIWLPPLQQYRWYQVIYQVGVFISRSSVNLIQINKLWILPILQFANLGFLLCEVLLQFVPNIWIIFVVILFEGLLGGAGYVNTFYKISKEVPEERREFSMGVASVSDTFGVALAGFAAIPVHNFICTLNAF